MRQIWIPKTGGPDVLSLREAADPVPAAGQVRIRVKASGVNFADTVARQGFYKDAPPIPFVPGYEVSGVVDQLGEGVKTLAVGDRVLTMIRFGGYADVVVQDENIITKMPDSMSFSEGAAIPVQWMTAWHMLVELGHLKKGQRVLVQAAAGGVGTAAVQICKAFGAEAIGTASASKHARLKELGCAHVIDYRTEDFEAGVKRITNGKGVDIAIDAVGGNSFKKSYRCLKKTGKLMMFGVSAMTPGDKPNLFHAAKAIIGMPFFHAIRLMMDNKGVFGINLGQLWDEPEMMQAELREIVKGFAEGKFKAIIDLEVPFSEAPKAHARLAARENFGKVLLLP
ncbi:MAG: zinc-binding dehydrogenase [Deltaproteobacteria bacterium]|nr:zinc-binding dehydrogenase [Deltaproteobacteria bacterium]